MWFTVRRGIGVIIRRTGVRGDHIIGIIITGIIRIITIIIMGITVLPIIIAILITIIITTMVTVRTRIRFINTGKVVLIVIPILVLKRETRVRLILRKSILTGISLPRGQQM